MLGAPPQGGGRDPRGRDPRCLCKKGDRGVCGLGPRMYKRVFARGREEISVVEVFSLGGFFHPMGVSPQRRPTGFLKEGAGFPWVGFRGRFLPKGEPKRGPSLVLFHGNLLAQPTWVSGKRLGEIGFLRPGGRSHGPRSFLGQLCTNGVPSNLVIGPVPCQSLPDFHPGPVSRALPSLWCMALRLSSRARRSA